MKNGAIFGNAIPIRYESGRVTYIFEAEVVEAEFKIDQRFLALSTRIEQIDKVASNFYTEAIISHVQAEQRCVLLQCVDHFLNATVFLRVVCQVV